MGKKKIAIIGHFGGKKNFLDGQTVKTKTLYEELIANTDWEIIRIDTFLKQKHPLMLLLQSCWALFSTKDVLILLSGNGMRFYFPILFAFSKFFGTKIYHDVIGGNLGDYVKKYPKYRDYLNSFVVNWVEISSVKDQLTELGVKNVDVLPNFKRLSLVNQEELYSKTEEPYPLCTFSRVMKEKGIEDAVEAVKTVNARFGRTVCELDIYGQIDPNQAEWFMQLQKEFPEYVKYKGAVPYDQSVEVLKDYYALLFPTFFAGEGFAGTLLDAMASGVPVIASDWKYNSEIVKTGQTGVLYPARDKDALVACLYYACQDEEKWNAMRYHCIEEVKKYYPEEVVKVIIDKIETRTVD